MHGNHHSDWILNWPYAAIALFVERVIAPAVFGSNSIAIVANVFAGIATAAGSTVVVFFIKRWLTAVFDKEKARTDSSKED